MSTYEEISSMGAVAIIGMNGRFPGADNVDEFWENLYNGVESVKFFNRDELLKMGIDEHLLDNPRFVAADAILDGMDQFDAGFFDYSAREAEIMDPQHRLFLESAWEVLESAGYNSELYKGRIAVYAGANLSGYMVRNLYSNPGLVENVGTFKIMIANSQDFLATRVSYKMNLTGPSVNVNTLCSSSMVAVHMACQNLLSYSCDIALAGGVSFQISRNEAFFYQEGGIGSGDGHCRAFDSKANGTVSGSGLAVVVLKRLEDAIEDGDTIHAIIRGTGINNDGSDKNSYTAPNVDGQADCIAEAIAMSGVDPETITYIDAHGTGTDLGDPIEIAALTKAFRAYTPKKQFCAIGSAKTNIGHLVTAGGLASVVKTVQAMKHKMLPPSLNFDEPNRKIDFVNSPFYINNRLKNWETEGYPLRAGVSSFGIGGTNTHVILEAAPEAAPSQESLRGWQLVTFSAKTETALEKMTANLAEHLRKNPETSLPDTAFSLQVGRRSFNYRRAILCRNLDDLALKLEHPDSRDVFSGHRKLNERPVVFMFPSESSFYPKAGMELYQTEPVYKEALDYCFGLVVKQTGMDIRKLLHPSDVQEDSVEIQVVPEAARKAMVFSVEYALAKFWLSLGIEPEVLFGEGVGEYTALCLAEMLSVEDALALLHLDSRMFAEKLGSISFTAPKIPVLSSAGGLITEKEAADPTRWAKGHGTEQGLRKLLEDTDRVLLEVGPGNRLSDLAEGLRQPDIAYGIIAAMPAPASEESEIQTLLRAVGKLWLAGGKVDWTRLYAHEKRRRIPLPTYPFERQRYWIEPGKRSEVKNDAYVRLKDEKEIPDVLAGAEIKNGRISIRLDFGTDAPEDQRRGQLEKMLQFREKLVEFCSGFTGINAAQAVSPVELITDSPEDDSASGRGKLSKMPRPELDTPYVEPRNETEAIIVTHWKEVLGYERIGVHDDFFTLGGHSLLAAAIAAELSKVFQVQIPMRELFEATTVEEVAKLVEAYQWAVQEQGESLSGEDVEDGVL